jgi:hypothetical protein
MRRIALSMWLAVALSHAASAQPQAAAPPGADPRQASPVGLAHLLNLRGIQTHVRYSPGALDRAAHVQLRLETLAEDFAAWSGQQLPFQGYVLGPEDWAAAQFDVPYGLPKRTGPESVAVPAWGDDQTVARWRVLLGGPLPWGTGQPVRGTPEEAASLALSDLLLQAELARMFLERTGVRGEPGWVGEVLAQSVALTAFHSHEAERIPEIEEVYAHLAATPGGQFAEAARGFDAARILVAKDGLRTPKRLLKLARDNGGRIGVGDLVARYPELGAWLRTAAVAPAGTR